MNDTTMVDTMIKDGLTDAFHNLHMGNTGILKFCILKVNFSIKSILF